MADKAGGASGKRAIRDVEPAALGDLLEHPPRATVAFVDHGEVDLVPVRAHASAQTHRFGVATAGAPDFHDREVILLIDDGQYWFELRGMSVRGVARRSPPEREEAGGLVWYAIEPRRVLAWDYATIREVD